MMDTGFDLNILWSLFGAFIGFVVFGISLYFAIVKPCLESILLTVGSFINFLTTLFYSIGMQLLTNLYGVELYSSKGLFAAVGGVGLLGTICFTSGLIVLIVNHIRINKKMKLEQYLEK